MVNSTPGEAVMVVDDGEAEYKSTSPTPSTPAPTPPFPIFARLTLSPRFQALILALDAAVITASLYLIFNTSTVSKYQSLRSLPMVVNNLSKILAIPKMANNLRLLNVLI